MPIRAVPSDFIGFALRKALNNIGLKGLGGEGGIRTPDSLATMSDFESGAFNRALPPLRLFYSISREALGVFIMSLAASMALANAEIRCTVACL